MAGSINKVILIGNLGRDPETRYTTGGDAVTNLRIATTETWKDKSGEKQEKTEWHSVVLFGRQAEIAGEYLKKGGQVYIEGSLRTEKYTDKQGVERYSTDVIKLELRDSVFRIVGTDGHRLSVVEGAAKTGTNSSTFSTLLLRSTASILSKLQADGESSWVQFSTCGSEQEFNLFVLPDGSGLIARRGQGQFPNYENVIPKAPLEAKVVFQRDELLDGLTKLSATARKAQNSAVKLELSKSPACMKAENDGTANRVALERARISGKARDIGLNHQYLTQYVKSLETDTVSMKLFPRAISEVVVFDSFRYQHLLMPLRD